MDITKSQSGSSPRVRNGGYDILRVVTASLVVLLHACVPYLGDPIPGLAWPVQDAGGMVPQWIGWSTLIVVMPIFLVMGGYFVANRRYDVRAWQFFKQRWRRLVVPILTVGPLVLTADLYIWLTGWLIEGHITPRKMQSLAFDNGEDQHLWGLGHLWFLQYLFMYSCLWFLLRKPLREIARTRAAVFLLVLSCAGLATAVVRYEPWVVFGFQHHWLPVPSKWLFCSMFFSMGVLLSHLPKPSTKSAWENGAMLMIGFVCLGCSVAWGIDELRASPNLEAVSWGLAMTSVAAASCIAIGAFRMASNFASPSGPTLQYMASASFWVYLVHHPCVGLTHVFLKVTAWELQPALKMAIVFSVVMTLSLLSYEWVVRRSLQRWVGLDATREKRDNRNASHSVTEHHADRKPTSTQPRDPSARAA